MADTNDTQAEALEHLKRLVSREDPPIGLEYDLADKEYVVRCCYCSARYPGPHRNYCDFHKAQLFIENIAEEIE